MRSGSCAVIALCLGLAMSATHASRAGQQAAPPADNHCGPPHYCAQTDRNIVQYSQTAPAMGPAGSALTDPGFGSRILRVTDADTDPKHPGASFHTPSSAEQNPWNSTTTKFYVGESGGRYLLYDFDPSKMAPTRRGYIDLPWRGEPQFSYTQPDVLYGMVGRPPAFQQYNVSTGKLTTIHDPASCAQLNSGDWGSAISASADDNRLSGVMGSQQDAYYLVYVFDRQQGCRWYNTMTGEIGGKWGPTGTASISLRFPVHDARLAKSGKFVAITAASPQIRAGVVFWEAGTTNVWLCAQSPIDHCSGHHAMGYSHLVNPSGWSDPMDLLIRPINDIKEMTHLIPDLPPYKAWFDKHISWNYINPEDTNPACFSTYRSDNPDTPGAPLKVDRAWENEVDCVETDQKAHNVWRFAHTFSSARNGFWSTPRGNQSQDGRFYMFTSDWENDLGAAPDGSGHRVDVFVVQLR